MTDRPCSKCIWETTDGCMSWECEPITREEVKERLKHGKWIHEHLASTSGGSYPVVRCSECKCSFPMSETNYCPNCGAKMDLVQVD